MEQTALVRTLVAERVNVLGYIRFLVRRRDLAEDIFQEVCAKAAEKCDQIKDERHLLMWLRTAARFESLSTMRKQREKHVSLDTGLIDLIDADWRRRDEQPSASRSAALTHCLGQLSPKYRELIRKRYFEQVEYVKLADELKRSVNSLYVTFSRIHAFLAECIISKIAAQEETDRG